MKTKPAVPATQPSPLPPVAFAAVLDGHADHFHALALDLAKKNLFTPGARTERLAREHFVRAETYRTAAQLAASN